MHSSEYLWCIGTAQKIYSTMHSGMVHASFSEQTLGWFPLDWVVKDKLIKLSHCHSGSKKLGDNEGTRRCILWSANWFKSAFLMKCAALTLLTVQSHHIRWYHNNYESWYNIIQSHTNWEDRPWPLQVAAFGLVNKKFVEIFGSGSL